MGNCQLLCWVKQVKKIPDMFSSVDDYLGSFNQPLIEETRASLCSGLEVAGEAPACEISQLVPFKPKSKRPQNRLGYDILTRGITTFKNPGGDYEPKSADLVLLTNTRVKVVHDLNTAGDQFVIASVLKLNDEVRLLTAKEISPKLRPEGANRIYAIYLINLTTNMRIWRALSPKPKTTNLSLMKKVLQYDSAVSTYFFTPHTTPPPQKKKKILLTYILSQIYRGAVIALFAFPKKILLC